VSNLAEVLQPLLARCRSEIRAAKEQTLPQAEQDGSSSQALAQEPTPPLPHPGTWKQQAPQQMHRAYQARQKEREDRFAQIIELRTLGMKQTEIAKRGGMGDACRPHLAQKWWGSGPQTSRPLQCF
jgi:hypothetical protein